MVAIYDARWMAQPCVEDIRKKGTWWLFPVAGRLGVAGLAPPGRTRLQVVRDGRDVHDVSVTGGVFAAILPPGFGSSIPVMTTCQSGSKYGSGDAA